jgi:hypothetical protein
VRLLVASRSCGDCQTFLYMDSPERFAPEPHTRGGKPMRRPAGSRTPCSYCPKQPGDVPDRKRSPETAVELTPRNWLAYRHYRECKAVGEFPADDLVRRDAAIIAGAEQVAAAAQQQELAVLGVMAQRKRG